MGGPCFRTKIQVLILQQLLFESFARGKRGQAEERRQGKRSDGLQAPGMQSNDGPRTPPLSTGTHSVFEGLNVLFSPFISMAMKTVQASSKPPLTNEQDASMRTTNTLDPNKFCIAELSHANSELPLLPREAAASAKALEDEEQLMDFHRLRTQVPLTHAVEEDGTPVRFLMTLDLDFSIAGSEGSGKREKFKREVACDLASASGLPPANFSIRNVSPGSIILDMEVMPDPLAHGMHILAAKDLAEQAGDPTSKLRSGKITSHATGVEVINAPASAASQSDTVLETPSPLSSILVFTKEETKKAPRSALRAIPVQSFCSELAVNRYAQAYLHDDFAHLFVGKDVPLYDNVNRYAEGILGL